MTPEQVSACRSYFEAERLDEAQRVAEEALDTDPVDIHALFALGQVFRKRRQYGLAYTMYERAATYGPPNAEIYNAMGVCLRREEHTLYARACFERAIEIDPGNAHAHSNLAGMLFYEGDTAASERLGVRALELRGDPKWDDAQFNIGTAWLMDRKWDIGWRGYHCGYGKEVRNFKRNYWPGASADGPPEWDGSPGKTVVIYGEQGLGDEIMFASSIPDAIRHCKKVILETQHRLTPLFQRSFPKADVYGTRFEGAITWPHQYKIDARWPIGSIGMYFRNKPEDFPGTPYLTADSERQLQWRALLDAVGRGGMRIGLSWTGGRFDTFTKRRSLPLDAFLPILQAAPDATFVSLQYKDVDQKALDLFAAQHGVSIRHWPRAAEAFDFDEPAALIKELDLVISVCQSAIHLSGALGVPCWVLTPSRPRWAYGLTSDRMPFYNSIRLFRQDKGGHWPLETVAGRLKAVASQWRQLDPENRRQLLLPEGL